ncbi:MAG: redox-regulated ATPase YchF [Planctomycetota bacterium]|nr:MAG: redox-regulated ATPase YchF [Planctomycetota bacterium]
MKVGLVGLPGAGKTSLFRALGGEREKLPHAPNDERPLVSVEVPDPRLEWLRDLYQPKKFTPARVEFCDLPGLPDKEVKGKAELLAAIRECDALALVLREFEHDPYGLGPPQVLADLDTLRTEFLLGDLAVCEGRIERLQAKKKKPVKEQAEDQKELALLERLAPYFESGEGIANLDLKADEEKRISGFQFLSRKPLLMVRNVGEDQVAEDRSSLSEFPELILAATVEEELVGLAPEEQQEFLDAYGIQESARDALVRLAYRACKVHSFFTTGEDEVRAWTIPMGAHAVEAAGKIHSDLARGFIRAEVSPWQSLHDAGDLRTFKAGGGSRLEGKDYVVADGDILEIRFSV